MRTRFFLSFFALFFVAIFPARPQTPLAPTPPMGWNSWNHFACKVTAADVRGAANAIVSNGMKEAGYIYVNIDDTWEGERDEKGNIRSNKKFPDMKALADYVHGKGLKLGIYSSPGPNTCAGYEGSYGHEEQDARSFAAWGIDYLKYDWCGARTLYGDGEMQAIYQKMGDALRATGRPIVYSLCQYGREDVWKWGPDVGGNLTGCCGARQDRGLVRDDHGPPGICLGSHPGLRQRRRGIRSGHRLGDGQLSHGRYRVRQLGHLHPRDQRHLHDLDGWRRYRMGPVQQLERQGRVHVHRTR